MTHPLQSAFTLALALCFVVAHPGVAVADTYALHATTMRAAPSAAAKAVDHIDANQSLVTLQIAHGWTKVRLGVDLEGFVPTAELSDVSIKVWKHERKLLLLKGATVERTFRVALGAEHPVGDKSKRGDGATPEGRFFLAELDGSPQADRYGARSLRLSYPSVEHARRGLREHLIDKSSYLAIVRAVRAGEVPPQHTTLGGSIRIHGGGSRQDWTLGCIALDDRDVSTLYAAVGKGTRVDIYASQAEDERMSRDGFLGHRILASAKAQVAAPALYTRAAMQVVPMAFPGGDIPAEQAVCSDIVVRALRGAGVDLQTAVFEDRTLHPERYPGRREAPRSTIDHRRVGNLVPFLRRAAAAGAVGGSAGLAPGDVVVFDTGIANGTPFDHIGIVDDTKDSDGNWRAINIWTVGRRTSSMALIGKSYPTVVAWFRLGHPYAYR
jgi:uncharacterized protein YijF (DUF1287 family)/L,D-peptidoglycan transpeptidase YkuD (ErfK/YbiS/YcfS/YnhG family)